MAKRTVKNTSVIFMTVLYALALVFAFGCKAHEHSYGKWIGLDSHHYRVCECGDVMTSRHVWDNGVCLVCKFAPEYTVNLAYEGVYDGESLVGYAVAGRGKAEGNDLVLPKSYDGLPVSVKAQAFTGDTLSSLTVSGVREIGASSFSFCPLLERVFFGDGLISLGQNAFQSCTSLKEAVLPESLETVGGNAFSSCIKLESINIPDRVESIAAHTFLGCASLETVAIGAGVRKIDNLAFFNCTGLKYLTVSAENGIYKSAENCIIEKSTEKLMVGNLQGTVADGVKIIGANAFYLMTGLTEVYIPASVERVELNAFSGCMGIQTVFYGGSASDWGKIVFESGNSALTGADINFNYNIEK